MNAQLQPRYAKIHHGSPAPRTARRAKYYFERAIETAPREELGKLQLRRLRATLKNAMENVPLHRERMRAARIKPQDIRSLEDVQHLPFTVKTDLRDNYPFGMFARPRPKLLRLHASSGTTGKPTVVGYTKKDLDTWADLMARSMACGGARPGDVVHNAYGYGLFTGGLGAHYGAERLGATVVPMSGGATERQVLLIKDFGARVLCSTPSYALNIAEVAERDGVDLRDERARDRPVRRRALERSHAARDPDPARTEGGRRLRLVRDPGPGCRHRVRCAGRTARLGGPFPVRDHRSRNGTAGARRPGGRAGDHHAHERRPADDPLPHPRHHARHHLALRLRAHATCACAGSPGATTTC